MKEMINLEQLEIVVDTIKMFFIILYTYYIEIKIIDKKTKKINTILMYIIFVPLAILIKTIKDAYGYLYSIVILIIAMSFFIKRLMKINLGYTLIVTTISLSINYVIFFASIAINFIPNIIFKIDNNFVSLVGVILIYSILVYIILRIKRFKKGIIFLQKKFKDEYTDIIVFNIGLLILLFIMYISNYTRIVTKTLGFYFIIFSIIMFITIQKSLQLYYKQKLQEREVEEIKEELKNKDKEIEELEKENLKLNKKNHSIAHKQKSLEYELEQMILNNQIANGNQVKDKIEHLSKEMQNETVSVELTKTNIEEIDSMLKYMQSECIKNKIEFELQINGNIHHMVNTYIGKEELEILIADLIKNAIIAIKHSENINKSILVRLGLIDGFYSLYVYDSGIEFEIETLKNFGIKPSTTHADDGGTGMGLMNTFDTLKKSKASLIIDEYGKPVEDNFTKVIKIIFDNRNEYKIESYRKKEIEENHINKKIFQDEF